MVPWLAILMSRPWLGAMLGLPAPVVTGITPNTGSILSGLAVSIAGTGFQAGGLVSIGGASALLVVRVSATLITAVLPVGTVGSADVIVTNPDNQTSGASGAGLFTFTL